MKIILLICFIIFICLAPGSHNLAQGHAVNYHVENKGISTRVFYAFDEPARYSPFEVYGPGDKIPHQKGRTDKNGFVSFLPDRAGKWIIKVTGESDHGGHGVTIELAVNDSLFLESFKKPLVATYSKMAVAVSVILGAFGIAAIYKSRRVNKKLDVHF